MSKIDDVLTSLRKVIRATDLHSKHLEKAIGLTAPQVMVMQRIRDGAKLTIGEIARQVSLSQATVTIILDKLEQRGFAQRVRSQEDRRRVHAHLTQKGHEALQGSPQPLQEAFVRRFGLLEPWEQSMLVAGLQRIASMMDAEEISASPVLAVGDIIEPPEPRETFRKIDIRAGTILEAAPLPEALKPSVRLVIDFGEEIGEKNSSAELTERYGPQDLVGRQVAAVVNLPPRQVGPLLSEVLTVGFPDEEGAVVLIAPDEPVPNGSRLF